jgi:CHAD domain-containing protein
MDRVLEIVLNLPEPTLAAWLDQKGHPTGRIDALLAETLDALPGFERIGDAAQPYALSCFDGARRLWRAGWRVTSEVSQQQRRMIAMRRTAHAPGVTLCETACDVALAAHAPLEAAFEHAPAALTDALADAHELKTVATLECRRLRWRRAAARTEAAVDIELNMARCDTPDAVAIGMLRELRVSVRYVDGAEHAANAEAAKHEAALHEGEAAQPKPASRAQRRAAMQAAASEVACREGEAMHAEAASKESEAAQLKPASRAQSKAAQVAQPAAQRVRSSAQRNAPIASSPDAPQASLAGALAALFAAAHELAAALPAFPVLADAIDRVGRTDVEHEHKPVRAKPLDFDDVRTPHQALQAIGREIAQQWFGNEAVLRDAPDVEFIHQLRVAQRRLKTATKIFPAWLDSAWSEQVEPRLKWLSDLLGQARDWDVFTDETLPGLAHADVDAQAWNATRAAADRRRLDARAQVQQALRSPAYAGLALAWLAWLSDLAVRGAPDKGRGRSLRSYVKKRVAKHYANLTREPKLTALDPAARHKVRIHAKRLRYMLEFFEPLASHRTRRSVTRTLSRMQSVLGSGNDAAVALQFLEQLQVEPYQLGFVRGWCEALKRHTAQEGERLLGALRPPKIVSGDGA